MRWSYCCILLLLFNLYVWTLADTDVWLMQDNCVATECPAKTVYLGVLQWVPESIRSGTEPTGDWERLSAEFLAATKVATQVINNSTTLLPGRTLQIIVGNTDQENKVKTLAGALTMMDRDISTGGTFSFLSVSAVMGTLVSDTTELVSLAGEMHSVPVITSWAASSKLSSSESYPMFSRIVPTELEEAKALVSLMSSFAWDRIAVIYQQEPYSSSLAITMSQLATAAEINMALIPFTSESVVEALDAVRAAGARVVVLVAFSGEAQRLITEAEGIQMLGKGTNYVWLGTRNWLYDEGLLRDNSESLNGVVGSALHVDKSSDQFRNFHDTWKSNFIVNPRSMYGIETPSVSALQFDLTFLLANALHKYFELTEYCESISTVPVEEFSSCSMLTDVSLRHCCILDVEAAQNEGVARGGVVLQEIIRTIEFEGTTGTINLNGKSEANKPIAFINVVEGFARNIGYYDSDSNNAKLQRPVIWPDGSSLTPADEAMLLRNYQNISPRALVILFSISGICILVAFSILVFNVKNRNSKVLKMSSPSLNNVTLMGCILCFILIALNGVGPDIAPLSIVSDLCYVRTWIYPIAFVLVYLPLLCKTFRLYRIFSRRIRLVKLPDSYLFLSIVCILALVCGVLGVWTAIDPPKLLLFEKSSNSSNVAGSSAFSALPITEEKDVWYQCSFGEPSSIFLAVFLTLGAIALGAGAFMSFMVRNVNVVPFNDALWITLCIWNCALVCLIAVPVILTVEVDVTIGFVLNGVVILLIATPVMSFLFVPTIFRSFIGVGGSDPTEKEGDGRRFQSAVKHFRCASPIDNQGDISSLSRLDYDIYSMSQEDLCVEVQYLRRLCRRNSEVDQEA